MAEQLPWFPYVAEEWEARTADLTLEEEGALMRLCRAAWVEDPPCTISTAPARLERLLGARWKKLRTLVDRHFAPVPDDPERVRCAWLLQLYEQQLAKHLSYVKRGKLPKSSARGSASSSGSSSASSSAKSSASSSGSAQPLQSSSEGVSSGPLRANRANTPAPGRARGVEAPRAAGASDHAAAVWVPDAEPALVAAYYAWLGRQTDEFAAANPEEFAQLEQEERATMGLPRHRPLSAFQSQSLREQLMCRARERNHWPDEETWIANRKSSGELHDPEPTLTGAPQ